MGDKLEKSPPSPSPVTTGQATFQPVCNISSPNVQISLTQLQVCTCPLHHCELVKSELREKYTTLLEAKKNEITELKEDVHAIKQENRVSREENRVSREENRVLREENKVLREENKVLREENKSLFKTVEDLKVQGIDTSTAVRKLQKQEQIRRANLLMGSTAYNLLARVIDHVFGAKDVISLRKTLTSLELIKDKATEEGKENKWVDIVATGKKCNIDVEEIDELLNKMRSLRKNLAHPTRITEEEEENDDSPPPTTDDLKKQADLVFNNRSSRNDKMKAYKVVELLNLLAFQQGKEILC